jgi:hypothetical protein
MSTKSVVTGKNITGDILSGKMPKVDVSIGIWPGNSDENFLRGFCLIYR